MGNLTDAFGNGMGFSGGPLKLAYQSMPNPASESTLCFKSYLLNKIEKIRQVLKRDYTEN